MKLEELVGKPITEAQFDEAAGKKDACYRKVKARYDVWPSAYASGALVKCRKVGAANWGNKSKKESVDERLKKGQKIIAVNPKDKTLKGKDGVIYDVGIGNSTSYMVQVGKGKKTRFAIMTDKEIKLKESTNLKKKIKDISKHEEGLGDRMSKKLKKHKGTKVKKVKLRGKSGMGTISHFGMKEDVFIETNTNGKLKTTHVYYESEGKGYGYTLEFVNELNEAEYQGRKVKLGKIMQGDTKKFKVYVKNPKGNVVKVNFGQGGGAKGGTMRIRKSNPGARKNFRARHNCDNPGPRHKARYWSCRKW